MENSLTILSQTSWKAGGAQPAGLELMRSSPHFSPAFEAKSRLRVRPRLVAGAVFVRDAQSGTRSRLRAPLKARRRTGEKRDAQSGASAPPRKPKPDFAKIILHLLKVEPRGSFEIMPIENGIVRS